jgi:hypothetical protein
MVGVMISLIKTVQNVIGMEEIVALKPVSPKMMVVVNLIPSIVWILVLQQQVLQPTPLPALQPNPLPPPQPLFVLNSSHLMIPTGLMNYGPPHSSNLMVTSKSLMTMMMMTMMMMMTLFTSLVTSLPCTSSRLLALGESSPP